MSCVLGLDDQFGGLGGDLVAGKLQVGFPDHGVGGQWDVLESQAGKPSCSGVSQGERLRVQDDRSLGGFLIKRLS